jgi:hypothetical protein
MEALAVVGRADRTRRGGAIAACLCTWGNALLVAAVLRVTWDGLIARFCRHWYLWLT